MCNSTVNVTSSEASATAWIQFSDPLDVCLFAISALFGFPTHSYVIWLITTGTGSVASEIFILNLAICETCCCMNVTLGLLTSLIPSLKQGKLFFQGFGITGRCVFQGLMCVDCYMAVVHPVTFLKYKPLRYRLVCCIPAWMIIIGMTVFTVYTLQMNLKHPFTWMYSTQFLLLFSIQFGFLLTVLRVLKRSGPGDQHRKREDNQMKRKAFNLILIITVSMTVTYLPYGIIGFSFILTNVFIRELFAFAYAIFILAGFVQPLLYLHRAGKLPMINSLIVCLGM